MERLYLRHLGDRLKREQVVEISVCEEVHFVLAVTEVVTDLNDSH